MPAEVQQDRRSAARRPPAAINARALTAAAQRLDPKNVREALRIKSLAQEWQREAWLLYRLLSEIHFGHDYYANVCSRVRLYAGFQADPNDLPVPLDELGDDDELPKGAAPATAEAAVEEMRRLDSGADGGLPGIASDFGLNLSLAGEGYLYGKSDPESATGETFAVYSTEELKPSDSGYSIHRRGQSMGEPVGTDDFVLRVWRRNRQFRDLADAPMMALLLDCDTLLSLKQQRLAFSQSRRNAGAWMVPQEWTFPQRATDPNAAGQATDDPLTEQMRIAFMTPLQDATSVGSVMPLIVRGPADTLDKARWQDFGRGIGEDLEKDISGARHSIAVGLDLPPSVLEGVEDVNHWGAWQVALDTFKSHIEPLILVICRALTDGYLRPALEARGMDSTGFCVGYDPTALIGSDDAFDKVEKVYEAMETTGAVLRRSAGLSEDDAPDDDEIQKRLYIDQQKRVTIREMGIAPAGEVQDDPNLNNGNKGGAGTPPNAADTTRAAPKPALAASGARDPLAQLGPHLHQLGAKHTAQVQTLADGALQRCLERAGALIGRQMRQNGRKQSTKMTGTQLAALGQELGREHVLSLGLSEDRLIDGELGELEPEYRKLAKKTLLAALLAGRRAVPNGELSEDRITQETKRQDDWISSGFAILSAAILAQAHDQLFTPAQIPSGPGEIDLTARVSPSAVRESLSVAGGASAVHPGSSDAPPGGVATGEIVMDAFREALQVLPMGWQWVYGYPDKPFEPHEALEGVEFASWTDDVLLNEESWPDEQYFFPSDHQGCACSYIPMFESDRAESSPEDVVE